MFRGPDQKVHCFCIAQRLGCALIIAPNSQKHKLISCLGPMSIAKCQRSCTHCDCSVSHGGLTLGNFSNCWPGEKRAFGGSHNDNRLLSPEVTRGTSIACSLARALPASRGAEHAIRPCVQKGEQKCLSTAPYFCTSHFWDGSPSPGDSNLFIYQKNPIPSIPWL